MAIYHPALGPCNTPCIEKGCTKLVHRRDEKNAIHQETGTHQRSTIYECVCGVSWVIVEDYKTWEDWRAARNSYVVMQRILSAPKKIIIPKGTTNG